MLPVMAVAALTVAVLPASGNTPDPGPTIEGTLTLDNETFTFEKADGSLILTQGLEAEKGCQLAYTDGSSQLMDVEGGSPDIGESGSFAGYKSPPKEIGTGEPAEGKGTPCTQNNGELGQVLWLSLDDDLSGRAVWASEIEIAVKFDVVIGWELFLGTDGNGDPIPVTGPAGSGTIDCATLGSDCGADSGTDRVVLETNGVLWDAIRLSVDPSGPANGAFSLPADDFNLVTNTHFHLVTALDCGDEVSIDVPGLITTNSTGTRVDNTNSDCVAVPISLTSEYDAGTDTQTVVFEFDLQGQEDAFFEWVLEWDGDDPAEYPLAATMVDFGDGPEEWQWCGGTYDRLGVTAEIRLAGVIPLVDVGGCLAHMEVQLIDGRTHLTEVIALGQDPLAFR